MKKVKIVWNETVTRKMSAMFEVPDDFIEDTVVLAHMDLNSEDYYIDEGIYEMIEFNDYEDEKFIETVEFDMNNVYIEYIEKVYEE